MSCLLRLSQNGLAVQVYLNCGLPCNVDLCFAVSWEQLNFFNIYFHFRMIQKKIPMMAASHLKDGVWAQGTVLGAVKLPAKTLGSTVFCNSHFLLQV